MVSGTLQLSNYMNVVRVKDGINARMKCAGIYAKYISSGIRVMIGAFYLCVCYLRTTITIHVFLIIDASLALYNVPLSRRIAGFSDIYFTVLRYNI